MSTQAFRQWRSSAHREFGVNSLDSNASSNSSLGSISEGECTQGQKRRSAEMARRKNAENAERRKANGSQTRADLTQRNNSADHAQQHKSAEIARIGQEAAPIRESQTLSQRSHSVPDALAGLFRESARSSLRPVVQRSALYSVLTDKAPPPDSANEQ